MTTPVLINPTISGTLGVRVGRGHWAVLEGSAVTTSADGTCYVVPPAPQGQPRQAHVLVYRDGRVREVELGEALATKLAEKLLEAGPDALRAKRPAEARRAVWTQPPTISGPSLVAVGSGSIRIPVDARVLRVSGRGARAVATVLDADGLVHVLNPTKGEQVLPLGEAQRLGARWRERLKT